MSLDSTTETSLGKKSASGASWASISRVVQQVTQTVSVGVLARLLSLDDYGLMGMSGVFVNFLQQLGDMGTGSAIVQREHVSERLNSSLFWVNAAMGLVGAVLLWVAAPAIALFYRTPGVMGPISVLALSFPLYGIGIVPQALLVRRMEYRKLFVVEVSAAVVSALIAIVAAWNGAGVWSLVAGSVSLAAINSLLAWVYSGWMPQGVFDWGEIRSVLGFSMNLTGFVLVNYFSRNTGHLIIGRYLGPAAAGSYYMAYTLLLYPLQAVSSVLGRVMFATFARIRSDPERFRSAMRRYLTFLGAVSFPVFLGLTVVADPMIRLFLSEKWIPVIPLFMLVAPFGALHSISSPAGQIYLSTGRTDIMLRMGVIGMIVQVSGYFAGLPWGTRGVLLGWALASVPVGVANIMVSHRLIDSSVKDLARELSKPALATLVMTAATWGWRLLLRNMGWTDPVLDLGSTVIVGALVYIGIVLVLRASFLRDVAQFLSYTSNPFAARLRRRLDLFVSPED